MPGYRVGSKWNDLNEFRCLLAFKCLQEQGYPKNMLTDLAKEISQISEISIGSVKAKIGNYKSVAGVTRHSNASSQNILIFNKYGHLNSNKLKEIIASGKTL